MLPRRSTAMPCGEVNWPGAMPACSLPSRASSSWFLVVWTLTSELSAAICLVEPFGVFLGGFGPGFAAAAEGAGEVGRALFVEGAAAFLAVGRDLDQQIVDQVLDVPGLIGRQVAKA